MKVSLNNWSHYRFIQLKLEEGQPYFHPTYFYFHDLLQNYHQLLLIVYPELPIPHMIQIPQNCSRHVCYLYENWNMCRDCQTDHSARYSWNCYCYLILKKSCYHREWTSRLWQLLLTFPFFSNLMKLPFYYYPCYFSHWSVFYPVHSYWFPTFLEQLISQRLNGSSEDYFSGYLHHC